MLYPGLSALGPKMYIGHAALGTKMYPGLYAPGTRGHADFGVTFRYLFPNANPKTSLQGVLADFLLVLIVIAGYRSH